MSWSRDWPIEPGHYWFYGRCWNLSEKDGLHFVRVRHGADRRPIYVTDGHFIFESEGAAGQWLPAELPRLPAEEDREDAGTQ